MGFPSRDLLNWRGGLTGAAQLHAVPAILQNRAFIRAGRCCPPMFSQLETMLMLKVHLLSPRSAQEQNSAPQMICRVRREQRAPHTTLFPPWSPWAVSDAALTP